MAYETVNTPTVISSTLTDTRPDAQFRYTTMAMVFNGPAVLQIVLNAQDTLTIAKMLSIATSATVVERNGSLAYRFGQFASTCEARDPATKAANQRALAASPFTLDAMLKMRQKYDSTLTAEKLKTSLAQALPGFLSTYDELAPQNKAKFCTSLPTIIANAVREAQQP